MRGRKLSFWIMVTWCGAEMGKESAELWNHHRLYGKVNQCKIWNALSVWACAKQDHTIKARVMFVPQTRCALLPCPSAAAFADKHAGYVKHATHNASCKWMTTLLPSRVATNNQTPLPTWHIGHNCTIVLQSLATNGQSLQHLTFKHTYLFIIQHPTCFYISFSNNYVGLVKWFVSMTTNGTHAVWMYACSKCGLYMGHEYMQCLVWWGMNTCSVWCDRAWIHPVCDGAWIHAVFGVMGHEYMQRVMWWGMNTCSVWCDGAWIHTACDVMGHEYMPCVMWWGMNTCSVWCDRAWIHTCSVWCDGPWIHAVCDVMGHEYMPCVMWWGMNTCSVWCDRAWIHTCSVWCDGAWIHAVCDVMGHAYMQCVMWWGMHTCSVWCDGAWIHAVCDVMGHAYMQCVMEWVLVRLLAVCEIDSVQLHACIMYIWSLQMRWTSMDCSGGGWAPVFCYW